MVNIDIFLDKIPLQPEKCLNFCVFDCVIDPAIDFKMFFFYLHEDLRKTQKDAGAIGTMETCHFAIFIRIFNKY